jgi:hypothetical protein
VVEQAEELLRSLCYVVSLALEPMDIGDASKALATTPVRALYRERGGFMGMDIHRIMKNKHVTR